MDVASGGRREWERLRVVEFESGGSREWWASRVGEFASGRVVGCESGGCGGSRVVECESDRGCEW